LLLVDHKAKIVHIGKRFSHVLVIFVHAQFAQFPMKWHHP